MSQKIFILYLIHTSSKLEAGLELISSITNSMSQNSPSLTPQYIIIDTAADRTYHSINHTIIPGDNSCHEFSGWDTGVEHIKSNYLLNDNDLILFVNDSFYTSYGQQYLTLFANTLLPLTNKSNWALGYMDDFPKQAKILDKPYQNWIRSNFFIMPFHCLKKIGPLTIPIDENEVFCPKESSEFWSQTPLISDNFKSYISSWLFEKANPAYPEYQLNWDRAEPVSKENYAFFKKKAMCILSEHYLTARLHFHKIEITNVNPNKNLLNRHIKPYYEQQL